MILTKGSLPRSLSSGFTYTSTTTSITFAWPVQLAVYRADGTKTIIGAGSQAITGLTANNTYFFYPYYDEANATLKFLQASDVTIPNIAGVLFNGTTQYVTTNTSANSLPSGFILEAPTDASERFR